MKVAGKHVVVTGGASGIGRAMARRFKDEGARAVVVADLQADAVKAVGEELGGLGVACNVANEAEIKDLIARAEAANGNIDVFCSNAGIAMLGDESAPDQERP